MKEDPTMRTRPLILTVAGIAIAALLAACGSHASSSASTADVSFAQLMIPHHQQAVQMADMAITSASSPDVQKLAEQIKGAQGPEISTMQSWLTAWRADDHMEGMDPSAPVNGDMGGMDMGGMSAYGMMTQEDMEKLSNATGTDFDRMWLQMMIAHHQGAVTMAQQVLDTTTNPEVQKLAQAVVDGQTQEIDAMQKLLTA